MVNVRELAAFSANIFKDALKANIKRPDGKEYSVFDQFLDWKLSIDRLQDDTKAVSVYSSDVKKDLDNWRNNKVNPSLTELNNRVAALEQRTTPFPG